MLILKYIINLYIKMDLLQINVSMSSSKWRVSELSVYSSKFLYFLETVCISALILSLNELPFCSDKNKSLNHLNYIKIIGVLLTVLLALTILDVSRQFNKTIKVNDATIPLSLLVGLFCYLLCYLCSNSFFLI